MLETNLFEKTLGYTFKNKSLLKQAFIHRSYINENPKVGLHHNERLEFLGDAVLELVVTDFLYEKFPESDEGDLTAYRSALVNAVTLGQIAKKLEMNNFLFLSKGESKDIESKARLFILADTYEAVVGALYMDGGYNPAKLFIGKNCFSDN
jgi:ribonuclease-3